METAAPAQEDENLSEGSVTDASRTETVAANGEQIVEREQTSQPNSAANADSEVSEEGQEAEPEERTETPLTNVVSPRVPSSARAELLRAFAPKNGKTAEQAKARYFSSLPCIKRQRDLYRLNPLLPRDLETLDIPQIRTSFLA